jgi:HEAT repeat protein
MTKGILTTNRAVIIFNVLLFAGPLLQFCGCNRVSHTGAELPLDKLEAEATRVVRETLASDNPQVRASAVEVVAAMPAKRGRVFMSGVQRLLKDAFVPVRFLAAVAVGDTGYVPAKNDVVQLLKDEDHNVRLAAQYAVGKLIPSSSSEQIRQALSDPDQRVRANAAFLLGKIGDRRDLTLLYQTLRDESSDDRVRLNCIEAIARLGDEKIYQKVWAMLISAYADDRAFGVRAMGALGNTQARDALLTMLKDDVVEVQLVAAEQLGRLGDKAGEKIVLDAFTGSVSVAPDQEGRARIQTLCALAIGQIRTAQLKKFLPELLRSESQPVRLAAAGAVFQCLGQR